MQRWLLSTLLAVFVIGGLAGGAVAIRNFASAAPRPAPRAPTPVAVAQAEPTAEPTPELAPHPPLRDFDENPPPFQPAGRIDAVDPAPTPQPAPVAASGHMTILLMGIDQRPDEAVAGGDPGRTDSMMLVSIDFDQRLVSMVSVPRDGFVVIPGYGNERVNAAYTYGELNSRGSGPALAEQTVDQLFGIHVDHYALVDIHSMEQIVDDLGGVWINNPHQLVDTQYPTDDYRTIKIDIPAGLQLMDGVTAVEYARTRHPDSDYGRESRQQQMLLAIRDRALQVDVLPKLPQLLSEVRGLVKTDISPVEAIELANFGRTLETSQIVQMAPDSNLTPSYTGPDGAAYINLTPTYRTMVHAMLTQPKVAAEQAAVSVYNAGAPVGSGSRAAGVLGAAGLVVNQVANAPPVTSTRIEAGGGARRSAELAAQLLGVASDTIVFSGDSSDVKVLLGPDIQLPASG